MRVIAVINEKGGTAKTTTTVNLAACLGELGKKILVVDLDGQAASSRWLGVEEDSRLADALVAGGGLEPIANVIPNVDLAPADGKIDSVAHELRPTQGGQLRKVLKELEGRYDYVLIDCPPSLGNRIIGNAMLAATDALVPVESSILALDGLRILLTMLGDIREGFGHNIRLMGVLACRYDSRTRLSRLVLAEMQRALPNHVFTTQIRSNIRLQEAPATQKTILDYASDSSAAEDYRALAKEIVQGNVAQQTENESKVEQDAYAELNSADTQSLSQFRDRAAVHFENNTTKTKSNASAVALKLTPENTDKQNVTNENTQEELVTPLSQTSNEQTVSETLTSQGDSINTWPVANQNKKELASTSDEPTYNETGGQETGITPPQRSGRATAAALSAAMVMIIAIGWFTVNQLNKPQQASASTNPTATVSTNTTPTNTKSVPAENTTNTFLPQTNQPEENNTNSTTSNQTEITTSTSQPASPTQSTQVNNTTSQTIPKTNDDVVQVQNELQKPQVDSTPLATQQPKESPDKITAEHQTVVTEQPEQPQKIVIQPEPLDKNLKLSATMKVRNGGYAIINGQPVEKGETYRGAKLVKIGLNTVELEYKGQRYLLKIGKSPRLIGVAN